MLSLREVLLEHDSDSVGVVLLELEATHTSHCRLLHVDVDFVAAKQRMFHIINLGK